MSGPDGNKGDAAQELKERTLGEAGVRAKSQERAEGPRPQSERVVLEKMTLYETKTVRSPATSI